MYEPPRYRLMVLALAGDSTTTSILPEFLGAFTGLAGFSVFFLIAFGIAFSIAFCFAIQ
ncbi:MAG: hypothetical protein HW398_1199 [Acidobacteria bacterium]|nr:hypothetical protein [Acidobacteriota bacterium]